MRTLKIYIDFKRMKPIVTKRNLSKLIGFDGFSLSRKTFSKCQIQSHIVIGGIKDLEIIRTISGFQD